MSVTQVDEIQHLGVSHFHFSLNWSALVPTGDVARPNATLLGYYRCFTQQLLRSNITPVVTLWHHTRQRSSLPAPLDTANKWLNRCVLATPCYVVCSPVAGRFQWVNSSMW